MRAYSLKSTSCRPTAPDRPVRVKEVTEVLVYDPTVPKPDFRFLGNLLVLGGEIDPFAREPELRAACRFVPAGG
ncbi:hypothetical protein PX52LOC_05607 [Limnoglobus roseus]|uniref:Uncharacterized protein n=1 Tax=Limnoglobus roseus TaxID=2598579 RepID=A0A5C1AIU5_9BACT|nr:hypothetical protein PX52LOC_05607 [Limnoglobus roseus]